MTHDIRHTTARTWRPAMLVVYRSTSDAVAKGAMFVVTVAAARWMSREDFGYFALATTLGWLGLVAADFGIQMHLARSVAQQPDDAARLLRRWLPSRLAFGLGSLALSLVLLFSFGVDPRARVPMWLFALAYAVTGLSEYLYYFFRGLGRTDLESTLTLLQRGGMCVLSLAVLWWRPTLTPVALAMLIPALVTLVVAGFAAQALAPHTARERPAIRLGVSRELVTSVVPIGIGILLSALYFRIDVFLLERWSGPTSVALYNAVFRVVEALRLFPSAVLAVAMPALCRASDLRPLARVAAPLTAAAIGAAVVLWFTATSLVPALYGASFADAVLPFRTLVVAVPLMTLNYALTSQLIGWHGHRAYSGICACALAFNVLLNSQLIPAAGMNGAAWATVWTEVLLTCGCAAALARIDPTTAIPTVEQPDGQPLQVQA